MPGREAHGLLLTFLTRPAQCHFPKDHRIPPLSESAGIGHRVIEILHHGILLPEGLDLKMLKPGNTLTV